MASGFLWSKASDEYFIEDTYLHSSDDLIFQENQIVEKSRKIFPTLASQCNRNLPPEEAI